MPSLPKALLVAGPTASGKSALALVLAARFDGVIVNVDSMQVYAELRVLTARPTPEEEAQIPHRLYGALKAAEPGSVAWWRAAALNAMDEARAGGKLPILTGGSGMYFAALTQGLTEVPDPGREARAEARALLDKLGPEELHAGLIKVDPATAARLNPQDSQRIARAWEVWRGTGDRVGGLAEPPGGASALGFRGYPARSAARRPQAGDRQKVRTNGRTRSNRRGRSSADPEPRHRAAGDAGPRGAGDFGLPPQGDNA